MKLIVQNRFKKGTVSFLLQFVECESVLKSALKGSVTLQLFVHFVAKRYPAICCKVCLKACMPCSKNNYYKTNCCCEVEGSRSQFVVHGNDPKKSWRKIRTAYNNRDLR